MAAKTDTTITRLWSTRMDFAAYYLRLHDAIVLLKAFEGHGWIGWEVMEDEWYHTAMGQSQSSIC